MKNDKKDNKKDNRFRLRSRRYFLTYPRLPAEYSDLKELALTNYERIFEMTRTDFVYVISKELHEDGTPHLHVFLEFKSPMQIYSSTKFDLIIDSNSYHGNYQVVKNEHSTLQYIIKSVDKIEDVLTNKALPVYQGIYYSDGLEHLYSMMKNEGLSKAIDVLYTQYPKLAIQRGSTIISNLAGAAQYFHVNETDTNPRCLDDFHNVPKEVLL